MTKVIYATATSFNGFIADQNNSLEWLFKVDSEQMPDLESQMNATGVLVSGSTTYEWVLNHEKVLDHPEKWQEMFGDRPYFVFTSRMLRAPQGADVRFVSGPIEESIGEIYSAADEKNVWIYGGGDLVGQFFDAGHLDEVILHMTPVTLDSGAPLLPRRIESDQLRLISAKQFDQFAELTYEVTR